MFEELAEAVGEVPKRERPDHDWIRGGTWKLIDERATLRKEGNLTQAEGRRLTRRIHKSLNDDRRERALRAGHAIMAALRDGDWRKGYGTLRAWTKECDPASSRPCYDTLEDQTRERVKLYARRAPPGARIPSRTERAPLTDTPPTDEELRVATGPAWSHGEPAVRMTARHERAHSSRASTCHALPRPRLAARCQG